MNPFIYSALSLRRRSVWEAADSGILLWRNNFVYFIPFFALPVWFTACALRFLPDDFWYLSYLALWWLKPLFDRMVLHVVSRRFFGSPSPSRYKELRRGIWAMRLGLLGDLLWRRFSPGRAACMPIRVLERIKNRKQFRLRKKSLAAGGLNFCSFISAFGLAAEAMLLMGETLFIVMATVMFFPSAFVYIRNDEEIAEIFIFALFCLNFILVESLYVCMGFGLYINSRVETEGWDLQLLFQKFAGADAVVSRKPAAASKAPNGNVLRTLLFIGLFTFLVPVVYAEPGEAEPLPAEDIVPREKDSAEESREPVVFFPEEFPRADEGAVENLETILSSPDFGSEKEGWGIRLKKKSRPQREIPDVDFSPWFGKIRRFFSLMLRFLVILIIAGFAGFAFYWFWKQRRPGIFRPGSRGTSYVNPLVSPESPESLFAKAEDFFAKGFFREAWASCLSACIGAFTRYRSLSFPKNATEYGCLSLVRSALPSEAGGFGELVQNWILFAYGGRSPGEGAFERALAWGRSLVKAPDAAATGMAADVSRGTAPGLPGKGPE